jgi:hypothetical protein
MCGCVFRVETRISSLHGITPIRARFVDKQKKSQGKKPGFGGGRDHRERAVKVIAGNMGKVGQVTWEREKVRYISGLL